jgi:hypothetical protein
VGAKKNAGMEAEARLGQAEVEVEIKVCAGRNRDQRAECALRDYPLSTSPLQLASWGSGVEDRVDLRLRVPEWVTGVGRRCVG